MVTNEPVSCTGDTCRRKGGANHATKLVELRVGVSCSLQYVCESCLAEREARPDGLMENFWEAVTIVEVMVKQER